jgi:hypothetical protein
MFRGGSMSHGAIAVTNNDFSSLTRSLVGAIATTKTPNSLPLDPKFM